jgi:hypothetical protein
VGKCPNDEWSLAVAKAIIAWCIGPALSAQLSGQMPQMLNGVWHLLKRPLHGALVLHRRCSWADKSSNVEWHSAFTKTIVALRIGPALSVQLGGQMPRMLNGV